MGCMAVVTSGSAASLRHVLATIRLIDMLRDHFVFTVRLGVVVGTVPFLGADVGEEKAELPSFLL
jgi:hypothetical protein